MPRPRVEKENTTKATAVVAISLPDGHASDKVHAIQVPYKVMENETLGPLLPTKALVKEGMGPEGSSGSSRSRITDMTKAFQFDIHCRLYRAAFR